MTVFQNKIPDTSINLKMTFYSKAFTVILLCGPGLNDPWPCTGHRTGSWRYLHSNCCLFFSFLNNSSLHKPKSFITDQKIQVHHTFPELQAGT